MHQLIAIRSIITSNGPFLNQEYLTLIKDNVLKVLNDSNSRVMENKESIIAKKGTIELNERRLIERDFMEERKLRFLIADFIGSIFLIYKEKSGVLIDAVYNRILKGIFSPKDEFIALIDETFL